MLGHNAQLTFVLCAVLYSLSLQCAAADIQGQGVEGAAEVVMALEGW